MPTGNGTFAESLFSTDTEGWTVQVGNPETSTGKPEWKSGVAGFATPVIYAGSSDEGGSGADVFMVAPSSYLGDLSACYGLTLDFQISSKVTDASAPGEFYSGSSGLIIAGSSDALWFQAPIFDGAVVPGVLEVQSISVKLSELANCVLKSTGVAPTSAEFKAILLEVGQILIRISLYPENEWATEIGAVALYQKDSLSSMLTALESNLKTTPSFSTDTLTKNGVKGTAILDLINSDLGVVSIDFENDGFSVTGDANTNQLLVTGTASTQIGTLAYAQITASFGIDAVQSILTLDMKLELGDAWTIPNTYPILGQTYFNTLSFAVTGGDLPYLDLSSRNVSGKSTSPALLAGLNFGAALTLDDWPSNALVTLISGTPGPLPVSGPTIVDSSTELISARGQVGNFSLSLPMSDFEFNNVEFVLYAYSETTEAYVLLDLALRVESDVEVAGVSLPLAVRLPSSITGWTIMLVPGRAVPISDIAKFLGGFAGLELHDFLPESVLNLLSVFELRSFLVALNSNRSDYQRLSFEIGTRSGQSTGSVWTIIDGVVDLTDISFSLSMSQLSDTTLKTGSLSGSFKLLETLTLNLIVPIPLGSGEIILTAGSTSPITFDGFARLMGGESLAAKLPATLVEVTSLNLDELSLAYIPSSSTLSYFSVALSTANPWIIIDNQLEITQLYLQLKIDNPLSGNSIVTGAAGGYFKIGEAEVQAEVAKTSAGEDWHLNVVSEEVPLPTFGALADLLDSNLADMLPTGLTKLGFTIYDLKLDVNVTKRTVSEFSFTITSDQSDNWVLIEDKLVITEVGAGLSLNKKPGIDYSTGFVYGDLEILQAPFVVRADKPNSGDWVLSVAMAEGHEVPLLGLVDLMLKEIWDVDLPQSLLAPKLTELSFTFDTGDQTYDFVGGTKWIIDDLPDDPELDARFSLSSHVKAPGDKMTYSGSVSGSLKVLELTVTAIYRFMSNSSTITFQIQYEKTVLTCVLTTQENKKTQKDDNILTVHLGGVSFGDILEFLINLVQPSSGFKLSSPWDVLNEINFDNLALTINLTENTVGIDYKLDKDLVIVHIDTIGLTSVDKAGKKTVDITLTGNFMGEKYTSEDPLQWDLLNDPAPSPPGKGEELLDLRYLGIGQNIAFRETKDFKRVEDVIKALEADFLPVPAGDDNPLTSLSNLKFSGDGRWLIGADFTLMNTLSVMGIFNDPTLYGLRIALSGEKAKSLAGLEFEILYKKVTDTIGVYMTELKVPDEMRELQFGEVSVTLPVIDLDIYTNGNFRLDAGFPVGLDFSKSFNVQAYPFVGYGGFYFALLDGATSNRVPKITNGNFDPVIEFGLGLAVGVGKTIDKGILHAGMTLTVDGILEGVIGWFNPDDKSVSSDTFYVIEGTAAIVGKVYGEVDFVVIKARIDATAYAAITLLIEAYEPIEVELELHVEVSASVKVVFVKVHFSFSTTLDLSFEIGSKGNAPWITGQADNPQNKSVLMGQRTRYRRRRLRAAAVMRSMVEASGEQPTFNWEPSNQFANGTSESAPQDISLVMMPSLTIATPASVYSLKNRKQASGLTGPAVQMVMPLFVPNSIPPGAEHHQEVMQIRTENAREAPFNLLVEGVLRWAISSLQDNPMSVLAGTGGENQVTITQLEDIAKYLKVPANRNATFTHEAVTALFDNNFSLRISTPYQGPSGPSMDEYIENLGGSITGPQGAELPSTIFPMIPELLMTPPETDPVQFWNHNLVSPEYVQNLDDYFNQFTVDPNANVADGPTAPSGSYCVSVSNDDGPVGMAESNQSMATVIFDNYVAMLAAGSVNEAEDMLKAYPYRADGTESLASIAESFDTLAIEYHVTPSDSIETIAASFTISPAALRHVNHWLVDIDPKSPLPKGATLTVPLGVLEETIATANADYPLNPWGTLTINGVQYQVRKGDTLNKIAQNFGLTNAGSLFPQIPAEGPRGLAGGKSSIGATGIPNATSTDLLQLNETIWIAGGSGPIGATFGPTFNYEVAAGDMMGMTGSTPDPLNAVASFFFVRNLESVDWEYSAWYRQRLVELNGPTGLGKSIDWSNLDSTGPTFLTAPIATITDGSVSDSGSTTYIPKQGDTLDLIAAYLELVQVGQDVPKMADIAASYAEFRGNIGLPASIEPGSLLAIPGFKHTIQSGESFQNISNRYNVNVQNNALDVPNIALANGAQPNLLRPQGVLGLPTLSHLIGPTDGSGPVGTFSGIAKQYNLSLDELARSITGCTGIFEPYDASQDGPTMTIPDVVSRDVDILIDDLVRFGRFNKVSAMVSRFLLNGLRVAKPGVNSDGIAEEPESWPPTQELWGLYEMIGQQFPAPTKTGPFGVTFATGPTANWVCFEPTLGADGPQGMLPKSGVGAVSGCTGDMAVRLTDTFIDSHRPSLTFSPEIISGPSAAALFDEMPERYSLQTSVHWQTATNIDLPSGTGPTAASGPKAGEPLIWLFPDTMQQKIASSISGTGSTASTRPYELVAARNKETTGSKDQPVQQYSWATAIKLRLQRQRSQGNYMPNSYVVLGADQSGRDLLLKAWSYLLANGAPGDRLYLLYPPSNLSDNSSGLVSDEIDAAKTFVLKTNLSTVTHSGVQLDEGSPDTNPQKYFAEIGSLADFLKYLWEASITASGGFYLNYVNSDGNKGFPADLFSQGDEADVWLVLLPEQQSLGQAPDRRLYPFNNCAVVAENLAASAATIYAQLEPAQIESSDYRRVANVPAGSVGFDLKRKNPGPGLTGMDAPLTPAQQLDLTRSLYSLVGFKVLENDYFEESNESIPIGPSNGKNDDQEKSRLAVPKSINLDDDVWHYHHVVPVAKLGIANNTPSSPALPGATGNPYRGITGPTGTAGAPDSYAQLDLKFHDVFGNQTNSSEPLTPVNAPVGYIDQVIGVAGWPSTAFDYIFSNLNGGVSLGAELSFQATKYIAGSGKSLAQAQKTAATDKERFKQIFYQVQQNDLSCHLSTNLGIVNLDSEQLKAAMMGFVNKAYVFASSATYLKPVCYETQIGDDLGEVATTYSTTSGALATANSEVNAAELFEGSIVCPTYVLAPPMNTLVSLVEGQADSPYPPDCDGQSGDACGGAETVNGIRVSSTPVENEPEDAIEVVGDASSLTVGALAANNKFQPLGPGTLLRTEVRAYTTPAPFTGSSNSLAGVASRKMCAVFAEVNNPDYAPIESESSEPQYLPAGLLYDNFAVTGILAEKIDLNMTVNGVTNTVNTTDYPTFELAFQKLQSDFENDNLTITLGDFAEGIQYTQGVFADNISLNYATTIVPEAQTDKASAGNPGFSLADIHADAGSIEILAKLNQAVTNFYYPTTPVYINYVCCIPGEFDTIKSLASLASVTVEQFGEANQTTKFNAGVCLEIPDLSWIDPDDLDILYAPYSPKVEDNLETIALQFGMSSSDGPTQLATINRYLPGIFADDVTVDGVAATPLDSFETIYKRLSSPPTFENFIVDIKSMTGLYQPSGVMITPLPKVPAVNPSGAGPKSPSWSDLADQFNISVSSPVLADSAAVRAVQANRSLEGFLRQGATIAPPQNYVGMTGVESIVVGQYDTVETVVRQFESAVGIAEKRQNVAISLEEVINPNANIPDLMTAGKPFLLPPNSTSLASSVTPTVPPKGLTAVQDQFIFPVEVDVSLSRSPSLVSPDFVNTEPVCEAKSPLSPRGLSGTENDRTLQMDDFATAFETAFADHKLKCAVSKKHSIDQDPSSSRKIWAVNFGPQGVSNIQIQDDQPQFYALRPLSTELLSNTFTVPTYISGKGLGATGPKKFENIDLDSWMRQALEAIDLFLTPQYSIPAFQANSVSATRSNLSEVDGPVGLAHPLNQAGLSMPNQLPVVGQGQTGSIGYDGIVNAKSNIALYLKGDVSNILDTAGATAGYYHDTAVESLNQQMLVDLSNAYKVDAIIQYPVGLTSNFGPGDTYLPPRISGKIVPDLYSIDPSNDIHSSLAGASSPNSIDSVADYFNISSPYLAEIIGDSRGLCLSGAMASYPPIGPTSIGPNDTINSIAQRFGVPIGPTAPDYWSQWTDFIAGTTACAGIGNQPLLEKKASFPISKISRQIGSDENLWIAAEFFGIDVGSLAQANQSTIGIFVKDWKLSLENFKEYITTGQERMTEIVNWLNANAVDSVAPATIAGLVESGQATPPGGSESGQLSTAIGLLTPQQYLYNVQLLPDVTLSTSKVDLARDSGLDPALSFIFDVKHESQYKKLFLNLNYVINEIEYDIVDVMNDADYQASSWLSFILPIGSGRGVDVGVKTRINQVQVPLPLRTYPSPPTLVGQHALISEPTATEISSARLWDYRVDFESHNAAQDTDHVEVIFGHGTSTSFSDLAAVPQREKLIFEALAGFIDVYPQLKKDLALLPAMKSGEQNPVATVAVSTLNCLVKKIAEALDPNATEMAEASGSSEVFAYKLLSSVNATNEYLQDLAVIYESPTGQGAPVWPDEIFLQSPTAPTAGTGPDAGFYPFILEEGPGATVSGMTAHYKYPSNIPARSRLTRRFLFKKRDIILDQDAWGGIFMARNEDLIAYGPLGPQGYSGPVGTNTDFVYKTPLVRSVNPLNPMLVNKNKIEIAGLTGPSGPTGSDPSTYRTLSEHLTNLLDATLNLAPWSTIKPDSYIQIVCKYGFPLALEGEGSGQTELVATTPIKLSAAREMNDAAKLELVVELTDCLSQWRVEEGPEGTSGILIFDVNVFSLVGATGNVGTTGPSPKPILRMEKLELPMEKVDWANNLAAGPIGQVVPSHSFSAASVTRSSLPTGPDGLASQTGPSGPFQP